jgi:hypothetical protein
MQITKYANKYRRSMSSYPRDFSRHFKETCCIFVFTEDATAVTYWARWPVSETQSTLWNLTEIYSRLVFGNSLGYFSQFGYRIPL